MIQEPRLDIRAWISREKLDELRDLIIGHGFRDPITVREINGKYEIQDGHRRFLAAKEAGLITIPCIIVAESEEESEATKLILNLGREDLSPLEISRHLHILKDRYGYDNESLAKMMNVGDGRIRQLLGLTKLPENLITALEDKRIGERAARALAQIENEDRRKYLLQYALDGGATVQTIEAWVRKEKSGMVEPPVYDGPMPEMQPPEEAGPSKLKCGCCDHFFNPNATTAMVLCGECRVYADKLFREIRKQLKEEEDGTDRGDQRRETETV